MATPSDSKQINPKLIEIALDRVSGNDFENFVHAFCPAIFGIDFIPVGGMNDGGADAFQDAGLFSGGRPGTFYQASIQEDHRSKIRHTVGRLREVGRIPAAVIYITSRPIAAPDAEEAKLSTELDVEIKIRDRRWIIGLLNTVRPGPTAFEAYLAPHIAFLNDLGGASLISASAYLPARSVCVFLGQEVDRRRSKSPLLESVSDSLILASLADTDPDKGLFLTREQIIDSIEVTFPPARKFIRGTIDARLERLSSKENTQGREIRWYRNERKACLPYETRQIIRDENVEDEFLRTRVLEAFELDAAGHLANQADPKPSPAEAARVTLTAIEQAFINNGLALAAFISQGGSAELCPPLSDDVDKAMVVRNVPTAQMAVLKDVSLRLLRKAMYDSTEDQRVLLGKLSRTYTLLFSLQADANVVEYFQHMSAQFVLFVGTDILVRALSEQYLAEKDRMTCNLLKILREAGSTLYLCDPVLDEVHRHLEISDWEFENYCARQEPYLDVTIVRHIGKILIRAYFYAKLSPVEGTKSPRGWKSFVGQFCDYEKLHQKSVARRQLRQYLVERFGLEVQSGDDLDGLVKAEEAEALAQRLLPYKNDQGGEVLALNDARMILGVYGMRARRKEEYKGSQYGFATWWLTHETRVQLATADLVRSKGAKYILRPDFVLNFISLSPTTEQVRKSYERIMPTLLGIQLANRMREDVFHDVMKRVGEAAAVDDARARIMMGEYANRLKGDHFKQYEVEWVQGSVH